MRWPRLCAADKKAIAPGRVAAQQFLDILCGDLGFHGNRDDYYDPHNSYLNDVLRRQTGLPILLCVLCMAIGRRLDLRIDGIAFPGHFMALYRDDAGLWLLDPFHGAVVALDEGEAYLTQVVGKTVHLAESAWQAASAAAIALRILHNLRNAYLLRKDLPSVLRVLDFLIAAEPTESTYWRERGLIHYREQRWEEAQHDLRHYFGLVGLFAQIARPGRRPGPDRDDTPSISQEDRRLMDVYRGLERIMSRLN